MNDTSTPTNPALILNKGNYRLSVDARKSRIRVEKKIPICVDDRFSGSYETRPLSIPMTRISVCLMHRCGDVLTFIYTAMGKKVSVIRSSSLPLAKVVNTTAFGPDLVETGGKPESSTLDKAIATISRMTGMVPTESRRLFNYDLLKAGVVR